MFPNFDQISHLGYLIKIDNEFRTWIKDFVGKDFFGFNWPIVETNKIESLSMHSSLLPIGAEVQELAGTIAMNKIIIWRLHIELRFPVAGLVHVFPLLKP